MKALLIQDSSGSLAVQDIPVPAPAPGECLVKTLYAGLNRRDDWIRKGLYPGITPGIILGSDACGIVEKGSEKWLGKRVIINPNQNWRADLSVQSKAYTILGTPHHGTLAAYIAVPEHRLMEAPAYLSDVQAGVLPLAALTAYRAVVSKGKVKAGDSVLVTGAGGGVAQFAIRISAAVGAKVYTTSGSMEKIEKSKQMGVSNGYLYTGDWARSAVKETGGFDVIIDSAGGDLLNTYLKAVKPGGKMVIYGATGGKTPDFDLRRLFWSQVSVIGSTMGNDAEFAGMVAFFQKHRIEPLIDRVYDLEEYTIALDRFTQPDHFGKIAIKTGD